MNHDSTMTLWTLIGLGAWHGINPGMGWLFAVALGMQEGNRRAVWRTLLPLAAGHALSVVAVLALALAAGAVIPLPALRWGAALLLVAFGLYRLASNWHPRFGGMQVGSGDLVIWSFLMASAHGAGLMLLPLVLGGGEAHGAHGAHAAHAAQAMSAGAALVAALVHTASYLAVTGAVAAVVYERLGLGLLRRAWLNVDLLWGAGLLIAGVAIVI